MVMRLQQFFLVVGFLVSSTVLLNLHSPEVGAMTVEEISTTRDSFLQKLIKNKNEGENTFLQISKFGKNRVVVGFDLENINLEGLTKATLVLTIRGNTKFFDKNGETIMAHRLFESWTEGNGRGFKLGRGDGLTWNCATDTKIQNLRKDCSKTDRWKGGAFAPATGPGVRHTNRMSGEVRWDVTADVLSGVRQGWLLKKKHENRWGWVRYYSREGAVSHPSLAPRLILEYSSGPVNTPPLANAGPDQTTQITDTVQLDGTSSQDLDGDLLTFFWTFLEVPPGSAATLSDPSSATPNFVIDQSGTYEAQLVVNDGKEDSIPDSIIITTLNTYPVADAGPDQTVLVGETVTLDGAGSFDVDGDLLTFEWMMLAQPVQSNSTLSDNAAVMPTFVVDQPGTYTIQLTVEDGQLTSQPDSVIVVTANSAPVANAGRDQTAQLTETVTLDGSGSTDVDGDALTFGWTLSQVPPGSTATLSDLSEIMPMFMVDLAGMYIAELIVNDGTVDSVADVVTITTTNSPPEANAGSDQTVFVTQSVVLDGTASSDVDGDPLSYDWAFTAIPENSIAALDDPSSPTPNFTVDKPGVYVLQLVVNDGLVDSIPHTVTIDTANSRPLAEAGIDQIIPLASTGQLDGSGSLDVDGDPLSFQWALTSVPVDSNAVLSDPTAVAPTFVADIAGMYVAQLIVNDGTLDSDPDTVTIATANTPPVAVAGIDQVVDAGATVNLDGTGSTDPESDPLSYFWAFLSTPVGSTATLGGATTPTPNFVADKVGDYDVQLIVNDGQVDSPPETVRITAVNTPPTAEAGPNQTVSIGTMVTLDGTGSNDVNADPLTFAWNILNQPAGSVAILQNSATSTPSFVPDVLGDYTIQLVVNDGFVDSTPDIVGIMTTNDPPVLDPIGDQSIPLGQSLSFTLSGSDPNGQVLTFSASPLPLPPNSSLVGSDGKFTFLPDATQVGTIDLTFAVTDGLLFDEEQITITISDAPVGGATSLTGRLLDTNDYVEGIETPIVGATISLLGTGVTTVSDGFGTFVLSGIPAESQVLDIAMGIANPAPDGSVYAGFREEIHIIPGVDNVIERPFFLPRIDGDSLTPVDPNTTTVVTNPNLEVTITVPPHTAKNPDDTDFTGNLSISLVPDSLTPAALPADLAPGLVVTIQPVGVTFATPVPISFPNIAELTPGSEIDIWSLDPATGTFNVVGIGLVSGDGTQVDTISGGVIAADWHFPLPPVSPSALAAEADGPNQDPGDNCGAPFGSTVHLYNGCLETDIRLPAYVSLSEVRTLRFVYKSNRTQGQHVLPFDLTIKERSAVPLALSAQLTVGGVSQSEPVFWKPMVLSESQDDTVRLALPFNANGLSTGIYPFSIKTNSHFCQIGGAIGGEGCQPVFVYNHQSTEYGRVVPVSWSPNMWPFSRFGGPLPNPWLHRTQLMGVLVPRPVAVSSRFNGDILVVNEQHSPFGAGWGLEGLQRLYLQSNRNVLITEGNGAAWQFTPSPSVQEGAPPQKISQTEGGFAGTLRNSDFFGVAVTKIGDLNADGTPDIAVGASGDDDGPGSGTGAIWILFLNPDGTVKSQQKISDTTGGMSGVLPDNDAFGVSLDGLGDLDGDGNPDLLVGNSGDDSTANGPNSGAIWVLFMNGDGTVRDHQKITRGQGGFNGFITSNYNFGRSVAYLGDLNGDDLVEVAVGVPRARRGPGGGEDGGLFILSLRANGTVASHVEINEGRSNFKGNIKEFDRFGQAVTGLGDLDGDGIPDLAVGSHLDNDGGTDRGAVWILFLNANGTVKSHKKISDTQGQFLGILNNSDSFGVSLESVQDLNNDGVNELIVGAHTDDDGANDAGALWVLFMRPDGTVDSHAKISSDQGPFSGGLKASDFFGISVTDLGDLNGDTVPDLVVGAHGDDDGGDRRGAVWVLLLNNRTFAAPPGDYSRLIQNSDNSFTRTLKHGTRIEFDQNGLQTAVVDRNGNTMTFGYNADDQLTTITDPVNMVTTLAYDGAHLMSVTDPANRVNTFDHDSDGNLTKIIFPDGTFRTYGYDSRHLMTAETNARGFTTMREYDFSGRVTQATLPDGSVRQTTNGQTVGLIDPISGMGTPDNPAPIESTDQTVSAITDGEGRTLIAKTGLVGEAVEAQDLDGGNTVVERDENGNPTKLILPSGHVVSLTYDSSGNLLTFTDETVGGTTQYTYESKFNEVETITDPQGKITTFVYDTEGNPTDLNSPINRKTLVDYDPRGLPTKVTDFNGQNHTFTYDGTGNLHEAIRGQLGGTLVRSFTSSPAGYPTLFTDPLNREFSYTYDTFGRVLQEGLPDGKEITYRYDAEGNQTGITPPGKPEHFFTFNPLGLRTSYLAPDAGQGVAFTFYTYNNSQDLTILTRPNGTTIEYLYDAQGRHMGYNLPRGQVRFSYDLATSNLMEIEAPGSIKVSYEYNGEFIAKESWSGPIVGSVSHNVDRGRLLNHVVNQSAPISYGYDDGDLLTQAGSLSITRDNETGLIKETSLNAITDDWNYDDHGRLKEYNVLHSGNDVFHLEYVYDELGRIKKKTEILEGVQIVLDYTYDLDGRIFEVYLNGSTDPEVTYSYDSNGNQVGRMTFSGTKVSTYDAQDRLLAAGNTTYQYNPSGDLIGRTSNGVTSPFTYDVLGNLIETIQAGPTRIEYVIDGNNRRIGRKFNGALVQGWLYKDQRNPIAELDGNGNVVSLFVYGTRTVVPDYMIRQGMMYRIISDHLGSPRLIIESGSGTIVQRIDYDEFGNRISDSNPGFQPFGFTGGLLDPLTNLTRLGTRDYEAAAGRWTTKDFIDFQGGVTNLYEYVGNDPLNRIDPVGRAPVCKWAKRAGLKRGSAGGVVCYGGRKFACIWERARVNEVNDCNLEHERSHFQDIQCSQQPQCSANPPFPLLERPDFRNPKEEARLECRAYATNLKCYKKKRSVCRKSGRDRKSCEKTFDSWLSQTRSMQKSFRCHY